MADCCPHSSHIANHFLPDIFLHSKFTYVYRLSKSNINQPWPAISHNSNIYLAPNMSRCTLADQTLGNNYIGLVA